MGIYLGLGSNLGDRKHHLNSAIQQLELQGVKILRCSPVIETPALLPEEAPADWNIPFLNMAIEVQTDLHPEALLKQIHQIQNSLGRDNTKRWSPRPIDIDILLWNDKTIATDKLKIPHDKMHSRHFVITPLLALCPTLKIPGRGDKTILQWSHDLPHHIPLWMGILNVTPDSFSDGGVHYDLKPLTESADVMFESGAAILDIGGESTRPGAEFIDPEIEWQRIGPYIERTIEQYEGQHIRPMLSIDTRHPPTAAKSIAAGVDFINDVSGLTDPAMIELAASSNCGWITMHSLTVPADPAKKLRGDPIEEVKSWLENQLNVWTKAGISIEKIIFDPGIGFGKDALQSLKLLQAVSEFRRHGVRLLVGHSRKSFLKSFTTDEIRERDLATIGASMQLCQQGVDIIRVHNIKDHIAAYRGWSHLIAQ